ncbi:MAG TPA: carboxypeptidase regulatory-like domain-containing protein [Terriglobia bacterium]|nr:carboxypeptidase regulatory-like domain-containing protein [Terriglobia bacterium]
MKLLTLCFLAFVIALRIVVAQEPISTAPGIEGIVFDEDSKTAVSGARVRAFEVDYDLNGVRRLSFVANGSDLTDNDGRFALTGLAPGEYFIRVENNGFTPIFYPNTTDWRAAAPLVHTGAGLLGIDVTIARGDLHRISGKINRTIDEPYKDRMVGFIGMVPIDGLSHEPLSMLNHATNKERSFEIVDVPSGAYEISAKGYSGRTRIDVRSEDLTDVEIVAKARTNLKGRIRVRDDASSIDLTKLQVWVRSRNDPFTDRPVNPESAQVAADGSFTIKDVTDEGHQLMGIPGLPENAYIERAALDGADALHSWMTAQSNSSFLDITVDGKGGAVSGHCTDGSDRLYDGSATVVLVPIRQLGELNRASAKALMIESGGTFRITGIRPGEYRLLAWHRLKGAAYLNAEFMSNYDRRGTLVKVERDSRIIADAPVVDAR